MLTRSHWRTILLGAVLVVAVFYVLGNRPRLNHFQGHTMGTTYSVTYTGSLFSTSSNTIKQQVDELLEEVNDSMSTYRPNSELMQFNRAEIGLPFKSSSEIIEVVALSQAVSELSKGAYDVTVGPLVNVWGFGPRDARAAGKGQTSSSEENKGAKSPEFVTWMLNNFPAEVPADDEVEAARARVDYTAVVVDSQKNTMTRTKDVFVDLSSIAKGYGVDQVASLLEKNGVTSYMVEIGGEVKVAGRKPDGSLWKLAISGPEVLDNEVGLVVSLTEKALATSGDYLNYYEVDGKKYSHTINPKTGHPEMGRLAEVAVISDTVAEADALATMFMVLGDEQGLDLANREGIAAYFTYHSGKGFESVSSNAFKPYLKQ